MKYLWTKTAVIVLIASFYALPCLAESLTGRQIMGKVDARDDGDNMTAELVMTLIDKNNHHRVRKMKTFSKDKGDDTLNLFFFTSPADVRDTGFLTYDYYSGEQDDDQWLYLPQLKKVKRIASSDKDSSFVGSDFSYADMTKRVLDEWKYKLLKEIDVKGKPCWLVEALPRDTMIEKRYGYTRSLLFICKKTDMMIRAIHWLREGNKIKYHDNVTIEKIDGIWVPTRIKVKSVRNQQVLHSTELVQHNVQYGQDIDEGLFVTRRLEKGL